MRSSLTESLNLKILCCKYVFRALTNTTADLLFSEERQGFPKSHKGKTQRLVLHFGKKLKVVISILVYN